MLQQNGPEPQENPRNSHVHPALRPVIDALSDLAGCNPEPMQLVAVADGQPRLQLVNEPLEQGRIRPHRLFAIDKKVGDDWRPVTHVLAMNEAEADRIVRDAFATIGDDAELRVGVMLDGDEVEARAPAPLELDNCSQCTYCGGQLDEFCRCYDCHRLRVGRRPHAFIPPSQRERPNTPPYDEGSIGLSVIGRPERFELVPLVELPHENELCEHGDEGGEAGE